MSVDQIKWEDTQFYNLESQVNVYTLTKVENTSGISSIVLVSSIDGEVIAVEYQQHSNGITPSARRIQFTYIPGDAEIVSIDAFTNTGTSQNIIIGITFIKIAKPSSTTVSGRYLNIYSCLQPDKAQHLDSIAESCQHIDLDCIPYQLTHTSIFRGDSWEIVFLLSGSDNRLHVYGEDENQNKFEELASDILFPEFSNIRMSYGWTSRTQTTYGNASRLWENSPVLCPCLSSTSLALYSAVTELYCYTNVMYRCQCEIIKHFSTEFDGPITTVMLFTDSNAEVKPPSFASDNQHHQPATDPVYHLLVTTSIEPSQVYRDVVHEGLGVVMTLPNSDRYDVVMCACVADVDFDGHAELVLGTYGQELLVYKYYPAHHLINKDGETDGSVVRRSPALPYTPPLLDVIDSLKHRHKSSDVPDRPLPTDPKLSNESGTTRRAWSQEDLTGKIGPHRHSDDLMTSASSKGSISSEDDLFYARDAYQMLWKIPFTEPILAVDKTDVTGDGINEIVVASLKGLHVLQPDLHKVAQLCEQRLRPSSGRNLSSKVC